MEDQNNIKLNKISLPPVPEDIPRTQDGKIDIEAISIGRDNKGYIIPDELFDKYLKELPAGTTNESGNYRAYNGGKLARLENDIEEASKRGKAGAMASNTTQASRRSIREILEELSQIKATPEELEEYGLKEGTTLLEAANLAQIRRAMRGDTKAAEYVRDTLGEKPADKLSAEITGLTAEDKEMLQRVQARLDQG